MQVPAQKKTQRKSIFASSVFKSTKGAEVEENVEFLKISLKKENDRRHRLRGLLEKYTAICCAEKKHIKQIKSALIEMKDSPQIPKVRICANPSIFVDNSLSESSREFFCTLLNTFYSSYQESENNHAKIDALNSTMAYLIRGISMDEEKILQVQKAQINEQLQLEGELMAQKNRIKEEATKKREVDEAYNSILNEYKVQQGKHNERVFKVRALERQLSEMRSQEEAMEKTIREKEDRKKHCTGQVAEELRFQNIISQETDKILSKKLQVDDSHKRKLRKLCSQIAANQSKRGRQNIGEQAVEKIKFQSSMEFK